MADATFDNLVVNNTLGIGTTEPAAQLHVVATEGISSKVFLESVNGSLLKVTAEPNHVSLGTENAFPLSINTNGLPRLQISSEGNVGIGTQPVDDALLAVNGTVKATAFVGDGSMLTGISKWLLAYAHDQNGSPTFGNINTLINAVQDGHRVRVLIDGSDSQYVFEAESLWIRNGIVYAQNTSSVSVTFEGDVLKFQDDSYHYMFIASTKGDHDAIRWSVGEHTPRGHTLEKEKMKWFIDKT